MIVVYCLVRVKSITLQNFRNHRSTTLSLSPGINVLVGDNAQGKTNLLEAVYLTCVGRGFRTPRDRELIKFGEKVTRVKTVAQKKFGDVSVEVTIASSNSAGGVTSPGPPASLSGGALSSTAEGAGGATPPAKNSSKKQIKINGIPIAKMGELMGTVTCVFFSPDELKLIKEAPSDRRRFMDIDISQMDKVYFYNLLRYNKILQQRNALLKTISARSVDMSKSGFAIGQSADELKGLDIWDEQLAAVGDLIIKRRMEFCEHLKGYVSDVHKALAPGECIKIFYSGIEGIVENVPRGTSGIQPESQTCDRVGLLPCVDMLSLLRNVREKDLRLRTTTVGPHRDDLVIIINGKDVRSFASQGQQRTAALSLKIAELKIFEEVTGEKPILLLDDVLSELDSVRQQRLLEAIKGYQSIISTTKPVVGDGIKFFYIHDGGLRDFSK